MPQSSVIQPLHSVQEATKEVIERVHVYMREHPKSELHTCGKMFGVLIVERRETRVESYLAAFSAKLDGSYYHEGFVPPVYAMTEEPIGHSKEESRRLQRLLFANYNFVNGKGETKNLLEIFANEKPILSAEQWFTDIDDRLKMIDDRLPPSGAGECCAPKLLQYALTHGMKPMQLAEFWVGAPSKTEIRQEGAYYAPCSGRCGPILRHMTQGLDDLEIVDWRFEIENFEKPEILYEDDYLMVVNKPAGLLSVPGPAVCLYSPRHRRSIRRSKPISSDGIYSNGMRRFCLQISNIQYPISNQKGKLICPFCPIPMTDRGRW